MAARMWGTVCAQKETLMPAGGRIEQSLTVYLTLEHRQAIPMGTQTTTENIITVVQQMLGRNRRSNRTCCLAHILHALLGSQMLKDNLELGKACPQRNHHLFNKRCLAIKNINLRVSDLAMN